MRVKTLKPHSNSFGADFEKVEGAEYDLPDLDAAGLIAEGLVAQVKGKAAAEQRAD